MNANAIHKAADNRMKTIYQIKSDIRRIDDIYRRCRAIGIDPARISPSNLNDHWMRENEKAYRIRRVDAEIGDIDSDTLDECVAELDRLTPVATSATGAIFKNRK